MKKFLTLFGILLFSSFAVQAQVTTICSERFNQNFLQSSGFTISDVPGATWGIDQSYSVSAPSAIRGNVPNTNGDSIVLTTPTYDFTNYASVHLSFKHICKISPFDIARIEYKEDIVGSSWTPIPVSAYLGSSYYSANGFNAANYSFWESADSLATPQSWWWKYEAFDLSNEISYARAQFRFVIKKGNVTGTQVNYGWLIDDFIISADTQAITPPTVAFSAPLLQDIVLYNGPFIINAKVKSNSTASLITPSLNYTATYNGTSTSGTILMNNVKGDSMWEGAIPQFPYGSIINYSITGIDSFGYYNTINSFFNIQRGLERDTITLGNPYNTREGVEAVPFNPQHEYGWSRTLYLASELSPTNAGGHITNIAFYNKAAFTTDSISIYMKATSLSTLNDYDYVDPIADGATLVWSGTYTKPEEWGEVLLQDSFALPANKNLLVYVINRNAATTSGEIHARITWTALDAKEKRYAVAASQNKTFPQNVTGENMLRPCTRIAITRFIPDSNSVAMQEIVSPKQGYFSAGQPTDISVIIKNRGIKNLNSCLIGYSINGVFQKDTLWTGDLVEDFNDTVTIGSFIPTVNEYDTIVTWVRMPNGIDDAIPTDDTIQSIVYGCSGFLSGTFNIGSNGEFATLTEALTKLSLCGQDGDIVFALESGVYNESWNFSNMQNNYKITIQSAAMHHDSVIIQPYLEYGIQFKNTTNITISHITIDAATNNKQKGVWITGGASDINISHCKILVSPITTDNKYVAIHKETSNSGILNNCRINNNIIDGGYYGIYMYVVESGSSSSGIRGKVTIDSNTITNASFYAINIYYGNVNIHGNTIQSRTAYYGTSWYGIYNYYCLGSITCNKVQTKTPVSSMYGISTGYIGDSVNFFSIINNEVYIEGTGGSVMGIQLSNTTYANIIHNSVYIAGTGTTVRAMQMSISSSANGSIKNNIFVAKGINGYPIYGTSLVQMLKFDIDYNCYHSESYIGYANGGKTNLNAWQASVPTDIHSINVLPSYIDVTNNHKLSDYDGFDCPISHNVSSDIEGNIRAFVSPMGANSKQLLSNDGVLLEILGWNSDSLAGTNTTIRAVVGNIGTNSISSMTIDWKFNGTNQPTYNYSGNLATGKSDTITLGTITYSPFYNNLSVYISSLNNGVDDARINDTLSLLDCFCPGALSGTLTIGPNSTFPSIKEALNILNRCGASGSITLALEDGQYVENIILNPTKGMIDDETLGIYDTLTITSLSGNRDNVWIVTDGDGSANVATLTIQRNNVVIKDLTITSQSLTAISYSYSKCVNLNTNCKNIAFDNCWLKGVNLPTTYTTHSHVAFFSENRVIENLRINNCHFSGGSHAIYFTANKASNVSINNNTFDSTDNYGVYFSNTSFSSFDNNTIVQRISNTVQPVNYIGIYMTNCNGDITNNRIKSIKTNAGIYLTNFNTSKNGIVANNEIYAVNGNGIYLSNSKGQILHNSILCTGNTATKALYVSNINTLTIKNNNFVTKSSIADYPIYITSANNVSQLTIDYNNYYSQRNTYIGYVGMNISSMADLRTATKQDANSVAINPMFQNESTNLMVTDNNGMVCPTLTDVTLDKNGLNRGTTQTTMGAYHFEESNIDAAITSIVAPTNSIVINNTPTDVKIRLYNAGTTALTEVTINWMINGVLQSPYIWTGNLNSKVSSGDITIGNFIPTIGNIEIVAFIVNTNNSTDQVSSNDTTYTTIYGCVASSTYTIGQSSNADFSTIDEALTALQNCGINSAVRLEIESGSHFYDVVLSQSIPGASATNTITFTSQSGNAADVVLTNTVIGNINHLVFSKLTFEGVSNKYHNIQFVASCDDIEFSDCILYGDTNSVNIVDAVIPAISALCHQKGKGSLSNFRMYRNYIYGGNYTLYFHGGVAQNDDITLKDNIIAGGGNHSIYALRTNLKMENNTISNRVSATNNEYRALYSDTSNVDIINNTFNIETNNKTTIYAMQITGNNYFINNCNIADNTINFNVKTATTTYGIYTNYNKVNNKNNTISLLNVESKNFYGIYHNYAISLNTEYNFINVVSSNNTEIFYGIYAVTCKNYSVINGNKIWMQDTTLRGRAITLSNFGTDDSKMSVVSNNELSLIFNPTTTNNDVAGIYIQQNPNVAILHNSIRISGGSQYATHGIYQTGTLSETGYLVIKNNNIDMKTPADYPIFISNAKAIGTDRGQINIDYNNLVAPQYVGYVGNDMKSIADWQTFVSTDSNSVNIAQQYINPSQSLEVSNKNAYQCPAPQQLNTDILGNPRYGTTAMGAYSKEMPSLDLALMSIDCPTITNIGDAISPAIVIKNTGTSTITSATINWSFNNVTQSPITWTGNLASLDLATSPLGNITTTTAGTNTIRVWISLVNGVTADDAIENDTIDIEIISCNAMLSGTFTVGVNGNFASMEEVANSLINCGIGGNVTFEFLPGIHNGSLQLIEPINGSDKYTILFTKANRNSSTPAILQSTLKDVVVLKDQKNISFDSLTIDATNGFTAIKFTGMGASVSSNISITNCNIYARKYSTITSTNQQYRCIDKQSNTGNIKDLLIRNCFITGGNYYGIYITNSTQSNDYRRITIDSNIITGTYNGGINVTYFKGGAIDNNIISTTVESSGSWAGITCSYYNDAHIRNNKIHSFEKTLTGGNGISNSQGNLASYVVGDVDISNNEIILKTSGTTNGIYISSIYKTNILHNSIYLLATGNARGIYLATVTACSTNVVKNNNIVVTSTSNDATAIVISNANYAYALYFELDYNNYYVASGNICKIGNAVFNTIPAVQTQTQQDANSISVYPNFVDTSIDLSLGNSLGLICPRHPKVSRDINGAQREAMTTIGAYTMHVYAGVDLQLTQIVEPINNTNNLCSPSYSSVKYAITNVGGTDIDFARHPMLLTIRTTGANNATIDTLISSGTLNILETKIFEVTNALFTDFIGTYNLEASLNCASDTITENDTIFGVYQINKLNLPYDEDFSNSTFTELTIENLAGTAQWTVVSGNNNGYIDPFFGTGKLAFSGSKGTISRLSTGQIELNRTAQPVLEFWYAHDTSHADMNDQLSVTVTFDGGNSHHTLMALSRYDNSISAPTWTKYFIDLSPYVDSSCAIIVFEGISYGGNAQYLDRIAITSNTNIALTDALAIDVNACSLNNKTLSIEMTNQTGQAVDFSSDMTSIIVEISGSANQTLTLPLRSGIIEGLAVDTFAITNDFNFSPGTYNIKAYISPAVDKTLTDDTIYTSIIINPNLTITPKQVTGGTSMNNCLNIGTKVYQEVNIANNGNLNMDNIELTLNIYNISGVVIETINESITGTLAAGEDTNYSFLTAYTVPEDESFNVEIIVNPACNTTMKYSNSIVECVDLINVGISKFIEPANSKECSKINSQQKITVTVINETPNQDMRNISINAIIYANNQAVTTLKGTIDNINASDSIDFTFSQSFVVPQANNYTIKVYIDKIDDTNDNDTLYITKCTDLGISESKVNTIGMSQNMPNPANDMAKVNYTIPNQGKVIFTIASVTGQILHTQEIEAKAGANSIEFNTANFADGIYFYTMDFNGHRLTKKMTIKK